MTTNDPTACARCGASKDRHAMPRLTGACGQFVPDLLTDNAVTALAALTPVAPATDYEALAALAEAATPGPWVADPGSWRPPEWSEDWGYRKVIAGVRHIASTSGAIQGSEVDQAHVADAAFIAAANPTTVLALIADLREARESLGGVSKTAELMTSYAQRAEARIRKDDRSAGRIEGLEGELSTALSRAAEAEAEVRELRAARATSRLDLLTDERDAEQARADAAEEAFDVLSDQLSEACAEVERLRVWRDDGWTAEKAARAERDAAEAAVARVRALHVFTNLAPKGVGYLGHCSSEGALIQYPCATIRALDGAES